MEQFVVPNNTQFEANFLIPGNKWIRVQVTNRHEADQQPDLVAVPIEADTTQEHTFTYNQPNWTPQPHGLLTSPWTEDKVQASRWNPKKNACISSQWVSRVGAYSSRYGWQSYAPERIVGETTVFPHYGDQTGSFVARTFGQPTSIDFIVLRFPQPVAVTSILIFETYNCGAVTEIWGLDSGLVSNRKDEWVCLVSKPPTPSLPAISRIFCPKMIDANVCTSTLCLILNATQSRYYPEIDAVRLNGFTIHSIDANTTNANIDTNTNTNTNTNATITSNQNTNTHEFSQASSLPDDVLGLVFAKLPAFEFFAVVPRVCRVWRRAWGNNPQLFSNVCLRDLWSISHTQTRAVQQALMSSQQHILSLSLKWCSRFVTPYFCCSLFQVSLREANTLCDMVADCVLLNHNQQQNFTVTREIESGTIIVKQTQPSTPAPTLAPTSPTSTTAKLTSQFHQLNIFSNHNNSNNNNNNNNNEYKGGVDPDLLLLVLNVHWNRTLTSLDVANCDQIADVAVTVISCGCLSLKSLSLWGCGEVTNNGLWWIRLLEPTLESLNLYNLSRITSCALSDLLRTLPNIRALDLGMVSCVDDSVLTTIVIHTKKLQELSLWFCRQVSYKATDELLLQANLEHLRLLDLGWINVTSTALQSFPSRAPNLTRFMATCSRIFADAQLIALATHCKHLTHVDMMGNTGITTHGVRQLLQRVDSVVWLDVSFCSGVSQADVEALHVAFPRVDFKFSRV